MRPMHILLAILVAIIWGTNFIFIQFSLNELSPLLLCTLRFFFACVPAIFFIKRPNIPLKLIILYSLYTFVLQFIFLFAGMNAGMPPGLTSLVVQIQMFFSIFFAAFFLNEKPNHSQILGSIISFLGIILISLKLEATIPLVGLLLILAAAASWGAGNVISKKIGAVNVAGLITWGSFIAIFPLSACALCIDGIDKIMLQLHHMSTLTIGSIFYIVYISTWLGYGLWIWLLNHYPVSTVVPFALLVPIFGMCASMVMINEPLQSWKIAAATLIILGLAINLLGSRFINTRT